MIVIDGIARFVGYLTLASAFLLLVVCLFALLVDNVSAVLNWLDDRATQRRNRDRDPDFRSWQRELDKHRHPSSQSIISRRPDKHTRATATRLMGTKKLGGI